MQTKPNVLDNLLGLLQLDRLQEAAKDYANDHKAMVALEVVKEQLADGTLVYCDCDTCNGWDGHSRRCSCGNRRVYWRWDGNQYWIATVY